MEDKVIAEREDFGHGKAYLRELLFHMVQDFLDRGNKITVCRPAFAVGCEIGATKRMAIRQG